MAFSMRFPVGGNVPARQTTKARATAGSNRAAPAGQVTSAGNTGMALPHFVALCGAATLPVYLFGKNHRILSQASKEKAAAPAATAAKAAPKKK